MKWTFKQWLLLPFWFIVWILVLIFQGNARNRYIIGKSKGYHCYAQDTYLNSTVYHFDPHTKPYKEYCTWNEYWEARGYIEK